MFDQEFLQALSRKLADVVPGANETRQKVEGELLQLLQRSLSQLHIITKEEFLTQAEVLEQAQQRISELERKLESLEQSA